MDKLFLPILILFILSVRCQDMYPKIENFHPPKGYQPVRGYEPPNYKPNINNHIIFQDKPKIVNSLSESNYYSENKYTDNEYNQLSTKSNSVDNSHPLLNLNRIPPNRVSSYVPINRPLNTLQNTVMLYQTSTPSSSVFFIPTTTITSTHRYNLPNLNTLNNVLTNDWRRTPLTSKIVKTVKPISIETTTIVTSTTSRQTSIEITTVTIATTTTSQKSSKVTKPKKTKTSKKKLTTTTTTTTSTSSQKPSRVSKPRRTKTSKTKIISTTIQTEIISDTLIPTATNPTSLLSKQKITSTFKSNLTTPLKYGLNLIVDENCMKCLCFIESWCADVGCVMDQGSLSCGWYQLKYEYWIDCGKPGGSWKDCGNNKECAESCVRQYMSRYGSMCTTGNTCADLARIHNGGPYGCSAKHTEYYGNMIARCLKRLSPYENIDELYRLTFPNSN